MNDSIQFLSNVQQWSVEISKNSFITLEDEAALFNCLYPVLYTLLQKTKEIVNTKNMEDIINIHLAPAVQALLKIPLGPIVNDIITDCAHTIFDEYMKRLPSLQTLLSSLKPLIDVLPAKDEELLYNVYIKNVIPQLHSLLQSPQINPQIDDIQNIVYRKKVFARYVYDSISATLNTLHFSSSREMLVGVINIAKNLCCVDGSLNICKNWFLSILPHISSIALSDFLDFLEVDVNEKTCFKSDMWEQALGTPTFIPLPEEWQGKVPIQLIKSIADSYGESLMNEYESRLATKLLHSSTNELELMNKCYQYLEENVFGEDCPCQVMFKDVQQSLKSPHQEGRLKTLLISPSYWPELDKTRYHDCPEVAEWKARAKGRYQMEHPKQLVKYSQNGTVQLKYTSTTGVVSTHTVSTLQATILICVIGQPNGILVNEVGHILGVNTSVIVKSIGYWLEKSIITATDFMGSILLQKE